MAGHSDRARRVAAFATLPFQLRGLAPIAHQFDSWLQTNAIDALEAFGPDIVLANDAGAFATLRQYCDRHFAWLVGLRHGIANKYVGPDPEFALTDYACGSEWDVADFERHGVRPIRGMLVTGNPWVDDVFRVTPRAANQRRPSILFAPTWNPETSAATFFDQDLVPAIRAVYPDSRIVIKPHPLMVSSDHRTIREDPRCAALFARWIDSYRLAAATDPRVSLVDDPAVSVAALYSDADILVSDGSSLVFEFALFERPILLYSSAQQAHHWSSSWDPAAPSNAMRDVGDQFRVPEEFQAALGAAFERHTQHHKARQRAYSLELHGRYRDGRSAERVATALRELPFLDVRVASRRPNPQFVADVERTLRNCRVRLVDGDPSANANGRSLTLRPGATQRFADAHFVSDGTRAGANPQLGGELAAPMLSFSGDARPIDADWVRADGDVRLRFATNSARPPWQRHVIVSVDVDRGGAVSSLTSLVDVTANPSEIRLPAGGPGSSRIGRRRFVPTDELLERASSDLGAARVLADREVLEAVIWRAAELSIASRLSHGAAMPSLLECLASWLALDLRIRRVRNVAIFGAGSHTDLLLPIWRRWKGPRATTILISDRSTAPNRLLGLPVVALDDLDVNSVDAVVLSSASHEGTMAAACDRRRTRAPVHAVWHHSDNTGPVTPADRHLYVMRRLVPFAIAACRRDGIERIALAGRPADQMLAAAVWQAWDGPEIVGSAAADACVWCSPEPVSPGDGRAHQTVSLWPYRLPSVAPGLLPHHPAAS